MIKLKKVGARSVFTLGKFGKQKDSSFLKIIFQVNYKSQISKIMIFNNV